MLTFELGVNHGIAPELVPPNQLSDALNTTLRGDFARPRSYLLKRPLTYPDPSIKAALMAGWVQGGCYYQPDTGLECLMLSVGGKLYRFEIHPNTADVTDVTNGVDRLPNATQCWLWQAENYVIWNDGTQNPAFYDGSTTVISDYGSVTTFTNWNVNANDWKIPAIGVTTTFAGGVEVGSTANMVVGDVITVSTRGQCVVQEIVDGTHAQFLNVSMGPVGQFISAHTSGTPNLSWQHTTGTQLPPGRIGTYGMGRIWMELTDGRQFLAGDAVGGSSGTQALSYRDAVLHITENFYLAGGGYFAVPGAMGNIQAMRFAATLDASLGQGPLQVYTRNGVFSCNAPTDRTTWQDITNPILTQSLIGSGATGQDSTQVVNGDTIFRSLQGLNSLILARREFATWGITPISREVEPTFALDSQELLPWASGTYFDNRYLQTVGTVLGPHGPYFEGLVPLNFDVISGIRGKQPAIYDSRLWTGLNTYKVFTGTFDHVERCFAFTYNAITDELELYEILPTISNVIADNVTNRVTWAVETGTKFAPRDPKVHPYMRLLGGEIYVDNLQGEVQFQVWWKPDEWPCWVPWAMWNECSVPVREDGKLQFRPRMSLPEPSAVPCDTVNNRPLREGYSFRMLIHITGHCTFKGGMLRGVTIPEPRSGPPVCEALCQ